MPATIVSFDSGSTQHLNVGSSFVKRLSALRHVDLGAGVLRLDRDRDDRRRDEHRRHRVVDGAVGERVARVAVDAEQRADVARAGLGDLFLVVGVHADEPADLDLLAVARVDDEVVLADLALVDADVGQLAVAAILELEREHDERLRRDPTRGRPAPLPCRDRARCSRPRAARAGTCRRRRAAAGRPCCRAPSRTSRACT